MSAEIVEASNMTLTAVQASHEIAVWIELSVRLIEALSVIMITLAIALCNLYLSSQDNGPQGHTGPY